VLYFHQSYDVLDAMSPDRLLEIYQYGLEREKRGRKSEDAPDETTEQRNRRIALKLLQEQDATEQRNKSKHVNYVNG
jgi:hypothetical protein